MKFERKWAMPASETFNILPVKSFVLKYLKGVTVDPFSRNKDWFTYSNDLDPETNAQFHMEAEDFLIMLKKEDVKADVIILDPPYSPRQISECYKKIGLTVGMKDTQSAVLKQSVRNAADEILKPGGIVLSFGWNSCGMGLKRGYDLEEILLVCHGGDHNDTICLCERKIFQDLFL